MTSETTPSQVLPSPETGSQQHVHAPSSSPVGSPTGIDSSHQEQASAPAHGESETREEQVKKPSEIGGDSNTNVVGVPPHTPTFKEKVYGYARLIRGTVLGRPDVKEQGTQVLRGEQNIPLRRASQSSSKQD